MYKGENDKIWCQNEEGGDCEAEEKRSLQALVLKKKTDVFAQQHSPIPFQFEHRFLSLSLQHSSNIARCGRGSTPRSTSIRECSALNSFIRDGRIKNFDGSS